MIYGYPTPPNLSSCGKVPAEGDDFCRIRSSREASTDKRHAAALQSHRTYHKVQGWRGNDIFYEDQGWKESFTGIVPIKMTQPGKLDATAVVNVI